MAQAISGATTIEPIRVRLEREREYTVKGLNGIVNFFVCSNILLS